MTRESCIAHPPKQAISIVRQDYYELMNRDACAAALLNIFEYWANAAISSDPTVERPWVGARPIREFEQMLLGISTDKQIRKRLVRLEALGFIQTTAPTKRGEAKAYRVLVPEIQRALVGQMTGHIAEEEKSLLSNNPYPSGQMTDKDTISRSNDTSVFGQMTDTPSVKPPPLLRSNDRALKKIPKEPKKEDMKEKDPKTLFSLSRQEKPVSELSELRLPQAAVQIGCVRYAQPPEQIDLAELWAVNPEKARAQVKAISPAHRRPEMVAYGVGQWWIGPGLNDFDEHLIQACRNRKRKFQQPDSVSDAKTFINNMLRNQDWGNFSLRCDEAITLRKRQQAAVVTPQKLRTSAVESKSPFERSLQERRASALGLVRFKVSQGDIERAISISQQFGFSSAEINLNLKNMPSTRKVA